MGRKWVRAIVAIAVAVGVAGAAAVAPAAVKPLTKKKALKLFYTKAEADGRFLPSAEAENRFLSPAEADALFLDESEADGRYLQGEGTVRSMTALPDTGESVFMALPGLGGMSLECASNGFVSADFQNQSGENAVVAWDYTTTAGAADAGLDENVPNTASEGFPGLNVDASADFEITVGTTVATVAVAADDGVDSSDCRFVVQAVVHTA